MSPTIRVVLLLIPLAACANGGVCPIQAPTTAAAPPPGGPGLYWSLDEPPVGQEPRHWRSLTMRFSDV